MRIKKKFELSGKELEEFYKWKESLPKLPDNYTGAAGGNYSFKFTPTGLGTIIEVSRADGHSKDITDTDSW